MTANQRFATTLISIFVVVFCLLCPGLYLVNKAISAPSQPEIIGYREVPTSAPIVVVPTYNGVTIQVEDDGYRKFRPDASWIGDDFNVEMTTPATVHGPANLEIEPHMGFSCALVRVNEGESLKVIGGGAYWEAGSTGALRAMWEHHKDKYLSNYPQCAQHVYESVAAFLLANPTYVK